MTRPGDLSWTVIVECFAQTGEWCETARLMFTVKRKDVPDVFKVPAGLMADAERSRREWLASEEAGR